MVLGISSSNKRCHGPVWVLPSSGDHGARLMGEPIVDYRVPHVFVTNNLTGWPQWSPNGTMLALNTTNNTAGTGYPAHAPFLLVAHFTALKPSAPLRAVNSQPGAWAIAPTDYHSTFGFDGTRTFTGPGGGTVTVIYGATPGVLSGTWSETYKNYSANGKDFVNGTVTIDETGAGTYTANLTMTGADTGSDHVYYNTSTGGHGTSTLNGHTVTGPSPEQAKKGACPNIQPQEPALRLSVRRTANGAYKIRVTAAVADAGANEAKIDTEPVEDATLTIGGTSAFTNGEGVAVVTVLRSGKLTVSAGDTLKPATVYLRRSSHR
jgi:hypothetical protein